MLKGVIVGFGEVARYGHWPAYQTSAASAAGVNIQIVAVVDPGADRRALASRLLPHATTFAALGDVPPSASIDFADICTPPSLHAGPMLEALDRGWHVLCEKPFLLDPAVV